jgi:type II secretory pathway pseudopilin PulG
VNGAQSGHTLLEVLASLLLLAVALVPLMEVYPALVRAADAREQVALLEQVAATKLEEVAQAARLGRVGLGVGGEDCAAAVRGCWVRWQVTQVSASPRSWLREVQATACVDANGNRSCESGELQVSYGTRVTSRP